MISMDRMDEERAKRPLEMTILHGISESGFFNLSFSDHCALTFDPIPFLIYAYCSRYGLRQKMEEETESG